jgi:hypothetical protein
VASAADKYVPVGFGASEPKRIEIELSGDALLQNYVKVPNLKDWFRFIFSYLEFVIAKIGKHISESVNEQVPVGL